MMTKIIIRDERMINMVMRIVDNDDDENRG